MTHHATIGPFQVLSNLPAGNGWFYHHDGSPSLGPRGFGKGTRFCLGRDGTLFSGLSFGLPGSTSSGDGLVLEKGRR
jgi:hypothetical protein